MVRINGYAQSQDVVERKCAILKAVVYVPRLVLVSQPWDLLCYVAIAIEMGHLSYGSPTEILA